MDAILGQLLQAATCFDDGDTVTPTLREATKSFLAAPALDEAIEVFPTLAHGPAAWLALTLGTAIETGRTDPARTGPAIFDTLQRWIANDDFVSRPTFPSLCQSVVAHLARLPHERARLRDFPGILDRLVDLEDLSHGAHWVHAALTRESGELCVVHAPSRRVLRVAYRNVANCFHLFSLLQEAIGTTLPGGRKPEPDVVAAAHHRHDGETHDGETHDDAWWHYGDPRSTTANLAASIWGEASALSIPAVDGVQTVVLWPMILGQRSWDAGFFGCALEAFPAGVTIERELADSEARAFVDRLGHGT